MSKKIKGVIFDWAGTTVDFGCFAPLEVFCKVFEDKGISVTLEEARKPMGMLKWDHINAMLKMQRIAAAWINKYGDYPSSSDTDELYSKFESSLMKILPNFTDPIEGVIETVSELRKRRLRIGSTTGYTREMMNIVQEGARNKGYEPHTVFCSDECNGGRPAPWMIFRNCEELNLTDLSTVIKVGDTTSDIEEGLKANVWSVGVIIGSSEMGLKEQEFNLLSEKEKRDIVGNVRTVFMEKGAHFTIETMRELPKLIDFVNGLLEINENPLTYRVEAE